MSMNPANTEYVELLLTILKVKNSHVTRNSSTFSHFELPNSTFTQAPLVTIRKTAWKKALKEMEWFLSGNTRCPDQLLDWWSGQLNENNQLLLGYGEQLRNSVSSSSDSFDQVEFIQEGLKNNPNSRRLIMTTWNSGDMATITEENDNPNTPTCCHSIIVQFFVRDGVLNMKTYQRSADMLLGVPHNWIQSWAMMMWFAHHAGLKMGTMMWVWGDAHIYDEPSHVDTAKQIIKMVNKMKPDDFEMVYNPTSTEFKADDFDIIGTIAEPLVTVRPKLL